MTTRHQPATTLPWNDLYPVTGALPAKQREQDVAFALHSANAYPRLVAALRDAYMRAALAGSGQQPKESNSEACERFGNLLRELGEGS